MELTTKYNEDDALWDVVITPHRGLFDLRLRELWVYRDLIGLFVRRNFVVNYRQTILGPLWYVLQPLATTAIFFVVFGMIARVPTDQIAPGLFYMSGILMWSNFSSNVIATGDVFGTNMGVFGKVYFPRLTVPIATILTSFITLALHALVFAAYLTFEVMRGAGLAPNIWIVLSPLLFIANASLALGLGLICSALTTRYRDLVAVVSFAMQLGLYATPVIYPLSQIPERWRVVAALNPMSTSIELFRLMVFGTGTVSPAQILVSGLVTIFVVTLGFVMFSRAERSAADTI
jgi:lipopolysaccharide transport system permease protein